MGYILGRQPPLPEELLEVSSLTTQSKVASRIGIVRRFGLSETMQNDQFLHKQIVLFEIHGEDFLGQGAVTQLDDEGVSNHPLPEGTNSVLQFVA